jgi:cell division protein FtsN
VATADSYFEEGIYSSAQESYRRALEKFPEADEAPYVRERLAESSARLAAPLSARQASVLRQQALEETSLFSVQVGSFANERNASALEARLKRGSFDAYVQGGAAGGPYRVRVGRFDSRDDAAALADRLKQKGYPTKIVP